MAVSRPFCPDCPSIIRRYPGGRIMVSVIVDPDTTLPNPRDERWRAKQPRPDGGSRNRKPPTPSGTGGRGTSQPRGSSLRAGKAQTGENER